MAVPSSGSLSMLKMAREAKYGNHDGSQSMGTISMYDMLNGGNTNGSSVSYPTLNTGCTPNPATGSNSSNILTYIERVTTNPTTFTDVSPVYYSGTPGVNTVLYTTPCSTNSTLSAGTYWLAEEDFGCSNTGCYAELTVNSSGVVTNVDCSICP